MVTQLSRAGRANWRFCVLGFACLAAIGGCQRLADRPLADAPPIRLAAEISRTLAEGQALAVDPAVDARLADIAADGRRGLEGGDEDFAKTQLSALKDMNDVLAQPFDVQIVSRPDEDTGFWRQSVQNPQARNYYVVVEAVAPDGRVLSLPITSLETQKTERVSKWAQRVSLTTFDRIKAEKQANGLLDQTMFGHKARGELNPVFNEPVPGGAITDWDN